MREKVPERALIPTKEQERWNMLPGWRPPIFMPGKSVWVRVEGERGRKGMMEQVKVCRGFWTGKGGFGLGEDMRG